MNTETHETAATCSACNGPIYDGRCYDCGGRQTETRESTFEIPAIRLDYLEIRMAELRKRAAKLALSIAIGFEVLRTFERKIRTDVFYNPATGVREKVGVFRTYHEVRVFGEAPVLEGWSLCGRFDFKAIPGHVMRAMVPGVECPEDLRDPEPTRCDACGVERRRNDSFLIHHEERGFRIVGRTCLRDYLGHVSPEHVAAMASILVELGGAGDMDSDFWGEGSSYSFDAHDLDKVLALAAYSIRTAGWAPSRDEYPTKVDVAALLSPAKDSKVEEERRERLREVSDDDRAKAAACIAWLRDSDADNDYMHNLTAIAEAGVVTSRSMGIAVSAIVAFDRHMEREIKRRQRESRKGDSDYVAAPKKRLDFTDLTVEMVRFWENAYGLTTFVKFRDEDGNVLVWKASNSPDVETGDVVSLRATVKAHEEYRGEKQTVITRGAKLEITTPSPVRAEG